MLNAKQFAHDSVSFCRGEYGWTIVLYGVEIDGTTRKRQAERAVKMWRERIEKTLAIAMEGQ